MAGRYPQSICRRFAALLIARGGDQASRFVEHDDQSRRRVFPAGHGDPVAAWVHRKFRILDQSAVNANLPLTHPLSACVREPKPNFEIIRATP